MKTLRFCASLACTFLVLISMINAQNIDNQGYEIKVSASNIDENFMYLQGYYGQEAFIFDSAKVKGHKNIVFKNKKRVMPSGVYSLTDRFGNEYLDLMIDKSRHFTVTGSSLDRLSTSAIVSGSEENAQFIEFQKQMASVEMSHETSPQTIDNTPQLFYESTPESFLGHYIKAKYYINSMLPQLDESDTADASLQYQRLIDHYFDHYTFEDARLLRTSVYLDLRNYFLEVLPQDAQVMVSKANEFLQKFKDQESYEYYTALLLSLFEHSVNNLAHDQVFVALFDQHCAGKTISTIPEDLKTYYQRSVDRKRKLLPGQTIPALVSYDISNAKHASSDIDKELIIIWFWDADCDECIVETPKLNEFYKDFANYYNLEVFAVAITDDLEKWDKFCKNNELSWINVNYYMNEPNYDFIEYFDLITTPVIYLIDKKHTIIDRNFPLEEIHERLRVKNN
ncbi:MAG: thioredoxin family protein [Bacteroidales bacterium]|nr:thioredoxin family protein [Bacteroidales bacterium]